MYPGDRTQTESWEGCPRETMCTWKPRDALGITNQMGRVTGTRRMHHPGRGNTPVYKGPKQAWLQYSNQLREVQRGHSRDTKRGQPQGNIA